ncbi:hypothetical protein [Herbaspirillum lusitanum]|uniref:hypothetical protein n=1 Tax=Herbaspirillum lusitanum TaxID=213312 RepID=UPI0012F50080|nr:hypothetical protein [Herbaspirillum lusitanum]
MMPDCRISMQAKGLSTALPATAAYVAVYPILRCKTVKIIDEAPDRPMELRYPINRAVCAAICLAIGLDSPPISAFGFSARQSPLQCRLS